VMGENIAGPIVCGIGQDTVTLRLRPTRPETAFSVNDQTLPDCWTAPSTTPARVEIAGAVVKSTTANADRISAGEESIPAPFADAGDGTLVGHQAHPLVSGPGCCKHAGVTSCLDFTMPAHLVGGSDVWL
jgi:hypothetical protein